MARRVDKAPAGEHAMGSRPFFARRATGAAGVDDELQDNRTTASEIVLDSITQLQPGHRGAVVVSGSHCGRYSAQLAARGGVRGVVLNDASVGKDGAGISGLQLLDFLGVPAVAVDAQTAPIGNGTAQLATGILSHVNVAASDLGCRPGMSVRQAVGRLATAPIGDVKEPGCEEEGRWLLRAGPLKVWALDSVSLTTAADNGQVIVTGSHGALLGGDPATAVRSSPLVAIYNDAGGGDDGRGTSRLPALDVRGIAAAAVDARTARIGDGRSTWETGELSSVNTVAARLGATPSMTVKAFIDLLLADSTGEGQGDP
jgi:hypothetical protein